jgi:hypothetical protein
MHRTNLLLSDKVDYEQWLYHITCRYFGDVQPGLQENLRDLILNLGESLEVGVWNGKITTGASRKTQTRIEIVHVHVSYCAWKNLWEEKPEFICKSFLQFTRGKRLWESETRKPNPALLSLIANDRSRLIFVQDCAIRTLSNL